MGFRIGDRFFIQLYWCVNSLLDFTFNLINVTHLFDVLVTLKNVIHSMKFIFTNGKHLKIKRMRTSTSRFKFKFIFSCYFTSRPWSKVVLMTFYLVVI